ncbi:MAG: dienelactone hydrolase family protein [Deltaproteobacteria bacterium]|nr:dienelactone hydrolase family protein [Deltaproteobacteria bacterium]MBW2444414.1 dienelactone hydrolase family protein [Deltaproteobacteria bacterium]
MSAAMTYDPFSRGPHPAGVVSTESEDTARSRKLPLELWYPASDAHQGHDLDPDRQADYRPMPAAAPLPQAAVRDAAPAPGRHPVVAFSHGFAGHRCQSTFLCTHLASHGYVVVAPDHVGNTTMDVMMEAMKMFQSGGAPPEPEEMVGRVHEIADLRPCDLSHALDRALDGSLPIGDVDPERVAVSGHSFGGWTSLMVAGRDPRVRAAVPLAPAGGATDLPVNPFEERMDLDWPRAVPTLYVVADRDSLLPLRGMEELYAKTREPRSMVVLGNTDHQHFCDNAEQIHELFRAMQIPGPWGGLDLAARMAPFTELTPADEAALAIRGLTLAHLDAQLGERADAAAWLAQAEGALADRGIQSQAR